jgi:type II secretory pathway pseudopilin PulG
MNIRSHHSALQRKSRPFLRGTTLVEMMLAMAMFGMMLGALLFALIFGMKQDQLAQSKLGASDESRRSFERVARDIRSANSHSIGSYSGGTFTQSPLGTNQAGNALRIFLTANTNYNIVYYFDTSGTNGTWTLKRIHTGDTAPTVIASNLQNSATFSAEDYAGNTQPFSLDREVIHFMLDFCEYQYPRTLVGSHYYYDRYVVDFRATAHVPGGR